MNTEKLFWNIYAHVYDLMKFNPPYKSMLEEIAQIIPKKSKRILDAGCGTGNLEQQVFFINNNCHITAIDISESMYELAKKKNFNQNIVVKKVDLNKVLPFKDNQFDCIVSLNTLYSVNKPEFTLKEFRRVLAKGGKLVIVNPNEDANVKEFYKAILNSVSFSKRILLFLLNLPLFVFNVIIKLKAGNMVYHFWNDDRWIDLIKRNGFDNIKSKPIYIQGHLISAFKI